MTKCDEFIDTIVRGFFFAAGVTAPTVICRQNMASLGAGNEPRVRVRFTSPSSP